MTLDMNDAADAVAAIDSARRDLNDMNMRAHAISGLAISGWAGLLLTGLYAPFPARVLDGLGWVGAALLAAVMIGLGTVIVRFLRRSQPMMLTRDWSTLYVMTVGLGLGMSIFAAFQFGARLTLGQMSILSGFCIASGVAIGFLVWAGRWHGVLGAFLGVALFAIAQAPISPLARLDWMAPVAALQLAVGLWLSWTAAKP
jgi:hypothetical protein